MAVRLWTACSILANPVLATTLELRDPNGLRLLGD